MKSANPWLCGLCAALLMLPLAACGKTNNDSVSAVNPNVKAEAPSSDNKAPKDNRPGFFGDDLLIDIDGLMVHPGMDIKEVIAKLGEDYEYSEAISCAYDGMDKTFIYPGVEFYTYPDGKTDRLSEITLIDETYATFGKLRVGCTEEEIKAVYGDKGFTEGIVLHYTEAGDPDESGYTSLYFVMENGAAESIGVAISGLDEE